MITVFLATYNRLDTLARSVKSFDRFTTPYEFVIVNNGTDHPKCIKLLERLEQQPNVRKIHTLGRVRSMNGLTRNFNTAIRDYRRTLKNTDGRWFAVTDADICFERSSRNALDAYMRLAQATGFAVGPHTRVDARLPHGYPLRSRVLATESRLLYKRSMKWYEKIPYSAWQIDTTFHLFPCTREFRRLHMNTVRCGPPYDAMHLDWYLDITKPTEETWLYLAGTKRPGVGSWGNNWIRGYWNLFQQDREKAFHVLAASPRNATDLCNVSFMLSWCHQRGYTPGGKVDMMQSFRELDRAVPTQSVWWQHRSDWLRMIYRDDFRALGWRK